MDACQLCILSKEEQQEEWAGGVADSASILIVLLEINIKSSFYNLAILYIAITAAILCIFASSGFASSEVVFQCFNRIAISELHSLGYYVVMY
jgi:hypothetical protein